MENNENVIDSVEKFKRSIFWKIYFWIFTISISYYFFQGFESIWDFIDMVIFIASIVALYAFCWNKKILTMRFWKNFFWIFVIWNVVYHFFLFPQDIIEKFTSFTLAVSVITLLSVIPMIIALYVYAYKNNQMLKIKNLEIILTVFLVLLFLISLVLGFIEGMKEYEENKYQENNTPTEFIG